MLSSFQVRVEIPSAFQTTTPAIACSQLNGKPEETAMSIWTDLLFLHGHLTTRTALALVATQDPPAPAARPDKPVARPDPGDAERPAAYIHHSLRVMGQVK
jgi:hypothetical protein